MKANDAATFTLAGPPRSTSAFVPLDPSVGRIVPVMMKIGDKLTGYRAYVRRFSEDTSEIRLRLPPETPPGHYRGQASVGGEQLGIVVNVEPVSRIRVRPAQSAVDAAAGGHAEFEVVLTNAGNIPFDIPNAGTFDLDSSEGQDRALGRALRAKLEPHERRVDRFFEEMRELHGGEAQIEVGKGAGALEPGASRTLHCRIAVPDIAQPGQSYTGTWELDGAVHTITVEVTGAAPRTRGRAIQ